MKINCDMGEGLDSVDVRLMPYIDMASVACGGHAGDAASMSRTVELAIEHSVSIGAHPSYPDRVNFGRKSVVMPPEQLLDTLSGQVENLSLHAQRAGTKVDYIKAHGALYNDSLRDFDTMQVLMGIAKTRSLPLVVFAHSKQIAHELFLYEAFVDRAYAKDGRLLDRQQKDAVHDNLEKSLTQAHDIYVKKKLRSSEGTWLPMVADTICIHSDSPNCVAVARAVRNMLAQDSG